MEYLAPKNSPDLAARVVAAILSGPAGAAYLTPNVAGGVSLNVSAVLDDAMVIMKGIIIRCQGGRDA